MGAVSLAVETHDFSVTTESSQGKLVAHLTGTADVTVKQVLDDLLGKLHGHAGSLAVAELVLDLRELAFMNSACLRTIATLIVKVRELPHDEQYHVVLVSNPEVLWQRRSLPALSSLAPGLVSVQSDVA